MKFRMTTAAILTTAFLSAPVMANEYASQLDDFAKEARSWAADPVLISAIKEQNAKHAALGSDKIIELDKKWRAEVDAEAKPLINEIAGRAASKFLLGKKEASEGVISEIFIVDAKGLNVAMSDTTSDYWQGDEAKFTESFEKGADAVHFSDVELDESTQTYQSQVSFTIVDPDTKEPIGAVTIGVDVGNL